jgi:hypothetical protein
MMNNKNILVQQLLMVKLPYCRLGQPLKLQEDEAPRLSTKVIHEGLSLSA